MQSVKSVVAEGFQVMILGDGKAEEQGLKGEDGKGERRGSIWFDMVVKQGYA